MFTLTHSSLFLCTLTEQLQRYAGFTPTCLGAGTLGGLQGLQLGCLACEKAEAGVASRWPREHPSCDSGRMLSHWVPMLSVHTEAPCAPSGDLVPAQRLATT